MNIFSYIASNFLFSLQFLFFTADLQSNEFHRITQEELNDLIRDLDLPKCKAELLGSRLQEWNLLKENVRMSVYCKSMKI